MGRESQQFSSPLKVRARQSRSPRQGQNSKDWQRPFLGLALPPSCCSVTAGRACCVQLFRLFTAQAWSDSGSGELELQSPSLLNLLSLFKSSSKPGIQKSPS